MAEENRDAEMCFALPDQEMHVDSHKGNADFHEALEDDFRDLKFYIRKTSTPALPRMQSLKLHQFGLPLAPPQFTTPFSNSCATRTVSHLKQAQAQFSSSPHTDSAFEEMASCKLDFPSSDCDTSHTPHNEQPACSIAESHMSKSHLPLADSLAAGYHSSGYHSLAQSEFSSGFSSFCSPAEVLKDFPIVLGKLPVSHCLQNSLPLVKSSPNVVCTQSKPSNNHPWLPVPMELSADMTPNEFCASVTTDSCSILRTENFSKPIDIHKNTIPVPMELGDVSDSCIVATTSCDTHSVPVTVLPVSETHLPNSYAEMRLASTRVAESSISRDDRINPLEKTSKTLSDVHTVSDCNNAKKQNVQIGCLETILPSHTKLLSMPKVLTPLMNERFKAVMAQHSPMVPDRLIGRRIGLEKIDIVKELGDLSMSSVIGTILKMLGDKDLGRMSQVSPRWKEIVESDLHARRRKKEALREVARLQELRQKENEVDKESRRQTRNMTASGLPFGTLQHKHTPSLLSPVKYNARSPTTTHQRYWKAASKLKNHESLLKCPRCQQPAKHHKEMERATCCNPRCQFTYCTGCFNAFHGSSACSGSTLGKRNKLSTPIGSVKSKKNLKRL